MILNLILANTAVYKHVCIFATFGLVDGGWEGEEFRGTCTRCLPLNKLPV